MFDILRHNAALLYRSTCLCSLHLLRSAKQEFFCLTSCFGISSNDNFGDSLKEHSSVVTSTRRSGNWTKLACDFVKWKSGGMVDAPELQLSITYRPECRTSAFSLLNRQSENCINLHIFVFLFCFHFVKRLFDRENSSFLFFANGNSSDNFWRSSKAFFLRCKQCCDAARISNAVVFRKWVQSSFD